MNRIKRLTCLATGMLALLAMLSGLSGCQQAKKWNAYENPVVDIIAELLPKTADQRRIAIFKQLIDTDADVRRQGVLALEKDPQCAGDRTFEILGVMAQGDPDAQVRLLSIQALHHLKEVTRLPGVLAFAATDDAELVRLEAATILGVTRFEGNEAVLIKMLQDDSSQVVRSRVAESLGAYPSVQTVRALIREVGSEEFRVAFRARQSLQLLTGQDFEYDQSGWEEWFNSTDAPLLNH